MARKTKRRKRSNNKSSFFSNIWGAIKSTISFVAILLFKLSPLIISFLVIWGVYYGVQKNLYADPHFQVSTIRVKTDLPFTAKEIEKMSGIRLGENILTADIQRAAIKIKRNPQIKYAQVKRILPSTIEVLALRRFEVFQIKTDDQNRFYAIDENGVILPKTSIKPLPNLVLIEEEGIINGGYSIGDIYPSEDLALFREVYQYITIESLLADEEMSKMTLDRFGSFTVFLADGLEIRLGKAYVKNLKKMNNVRHILSPGEREKIQYLDLQYRDVVVKNK